MTCSILVDRPDPLRLPEVLIVIGVLLIWCGSIFIFIRHSELLRIRHRDLPFRSTVKLPITSNVMTIVPRASDVMSNSKSRLSTTGGLTPPPFPHGSKNRETPETKRKSTPQLSQHEQQTCSFDLNPPSSTTETSLKPEEKQNLLDPQRVSSEIRESLLTLHRRSIENVSTTQYNTSFSASEMSRRKHPDSPGHLHEKRSVQESPV